MYPYLFHLKWLPSYGVMMALGIIAALLLFRLLSVKKKLSDDAFITYGIIVVVSIALGLVGARLFQMLYNYIAVGKAGTGITFMGGLITAVAVFILSYFVAVKGFKRNYLKGDFITVVNMAVPCIALGHGIGRIGCFLAGCCYGIETDSFLGVKFVRAISESGQWIYFDRPRLPTQLFEAVFVFLIFAVTLVVLFKTKGWAPVLIYVYSYSIFRFVIEFWRDDYRGGKGVLSPSQWQSIVMFIFAAALTTYLIFRKRRNQCLKSPPSASTI